MSRPAVVVFDVNETLTDMAPLRGRVEQVGAPASLFDAWFAGTLRDGFAVTAAGGFAEFAVVAEAVLTGMLADAHIDRDPAGAAREVLAGFADLRVHPDVPDGLRRLRDAGMRLVTLTNGSAAMSEGAFARAGVLDLFEQRLDVTGPRRWKPAVEAYRFAADATGVEPAGMALVAVHPWDVDGAARAGLTAAWLNRGRRSYPRFFTSPHLTGTSLPEVAEAILAA